MKNRFPNLFAVLIAIAASTGCAKKNEFVPPPPPEVGVQAPKVETTTVYSEYSGRTSGSSRVEIRARVTGFLKETKFEAGQFVEAGMLLFTIEPEQFEAAIATATGNLEKAVADQEIAKTNWDRLKQAKKVNAVSEIDVLSAEAEKKAADAGVMIAKAALDNANRDKGYTEIHAPVSGRVSNAQVDQGNLVGAADPTLLTDIVTVRPIYFNFEASEREVLRYLGDMPNAENPTGSGKGKELELELVLADGTPFEETGRFDFADNSIDPNSGTLRLRAVFDNEKGLLVDGLFARIRIPEKVENAVIVPAQAIQRDLGGSFVLVVNESNVVERRTVVATTLEVGGGNKIIRPYDESSGSGLQPSDRFVVSNLQRAREGLKVRPVESGGASSGSAAPEPAAPSGKNAPEEPVGGPAKAKAE